MEATKETEAELKRLLNEQKKTLAQSEELEKKREAQEKRDLDGALKVRMREVEKIERVRLESQMKCEKQRACMEMDQMRRHFEEENRKRAEDEKIRSCEIESRRREEESKRGYEAAKSTLEKAQSDIKKFESGSASGASPAP